MGPLGVRDSMTGLPVHEIEVDEVAPNPLLNKPIVGFGAMDVCNPPGTKCEVPVPEGYVASSGRWKIEVISDNEDGTCTVEHAPDEVCQTRIRYSESSSTIYLERVRSCQS